MDWFLYDIDLRHERVKSFNGDPPEEENVDRRPALNSYFIKLAGALSNPPEVFYEKAVLKILAIFTGKHLCWCLF